MNTLETLRKTYRYNEWANHRAIESIKQMAAPSQKAIQFLAHIVFAEQEWLARIGTSKDSTGMNFWQELTLEECQQLNAENQRSLQALLAESDEGKLDSIIVYKNSKGTEYHTPIREILMHVAFHSAYHRGQITSAVKAEGGVPLYTDFIYFLREAD